MRSIPAIVVLISTLFVAVPGCQSTPATPAAAATPAPSLELVGTEWNCVAIGGAAIESGVRAPTMRFNEDGRVAGATPVNRYGAPFETKKVEQGYELRFGPVVATRMAGEEREMRVESAFTRALETVDSAKLVGDRLELFAGSACVLAFDRAVQ